MRPSVLVTALAMIGFVGVAAADDPAPGEGDAPPKLPKQGDFDAGGQVRLPNGPDATGKYATFNWVALDLKGRYYIMDKMTADMTIPLAIIHPDLPMGAPAGSPEPKMIGGVNARIEAMFGPVGAGLTLGYMRAHAMLLSDKDFPAYIGDFKPGLAVGPIVKLKLGQTLNLTTTPNVIFQSGTGDAVNGDGDSAIQVPVSVWLKLGTLLQVSADAGVYTGDDFKLKAKDGGRLALGASLTVKLGPILLHGGAGFASLLVDDAGAYHSIGDSLYIDLNVKYVK